MGIRIHRAMGWGMPWEKFTELCKLPSHEEGAGEQLDRTFGKLSQDDFMVPREYYKKLFYAKDRVRVPIILECNLLAENYTEGGRAEPRYTNSARNLYTIVMNPDKINHIIFYPNAQYAKHWYRFDDDMDYQFEAWRDTDGKRGQQQEPRDVIKYLDYGHYPFTNNLMLEDGTPVAWDHYLVVEKHPEWVPAVPSEIRWYLTKHNVLDNDGVNKLRPLLAQWWC